MYEWKIKYKNNSIAVVLAERWEVKANTIYFYQHSHVIKQLSKNGIYSIKKVWPETEDEVIV